MLAAYPFIVYFGLGRFEPRVLYLIVGILLGIRGLIGLRSLNVEHVRKLAPPAIAITAVLAAGAWFNSETLFLLIPGIISAVLGGFFMVSYFSPPSMIEVFARMSVSDMTDETVQYTRRVTLVWVGFFLFNTAVVCYLSFFASKEAWAIYTGVIAYLLIALLLAVEFLYRVWKFRNYRGYWFDPYLRALFPPRGNVKETYVPLHKLMVQGRRHGATVAKGMNREYTWKDLQNRVSDLTGVLQEEAEPTRENDPEDPHWVLACKNTFEFCVGLLSIWQAGGVAVLPPIDQMDQLEQFLDERVTGVVTDGKPEDLGVSPVVRTESASDQSVSFDIVDRDRRVVELYTSGSAGNRSTVPKTLDNLAREVRTLEEQWREDIGEAVVLSTVPHQHIYGLLFRLLWPLSAGRVFDEETHLYPGELEERHRRICEETSCLVSSPAHLQRLIRHEPDAGFAEQTVVVFSSGGPLPEGTARELQQIFGRYPYEVFGSTETGGVAWRNRGGSDSLWQPFEPVEVRGTDVLEVRSPFLSSPEEWHRTDDLVEFKNGKFKLKGRRDREVNIAEKRISLPEMEEQLDRHEHVKTSAVTAVRREDGDTVRHVPAAVAVLSEEGQDVLNREGKKKINRLLRQHLQEVFEPVVVPRLWRYVEELPRDARGKVPEKKLKRLF